MSLYAAIVFAIDAAIKSEDKCTDESTKHASFCEAVYATINVPVASTDYSAFISAILSAIISSIFATFVAAVVATFNATL